MLPPLLLPPRAKVAIADADGRESKSKIVYKCNERQKEGMERSIEEVERFHAGVSKERATQMTIWAFADRLDSQAQILYLVSCHVFIAAIPGLTSRLGRNLASALAQRYLSRL
jgi:hypothetical protein